MLTLIIFPMNWSQFYVVGTSVTLVWLCVFVFFEKLKIKSSKRAKKSKLKLKGIWDIPGPFSVPFFGTRWIYFWKYRMNKIHEVYKDLSKKYGRIIREVAAGNTPVVSIFDRDDIDKVLRYPSKYPFRPPTEAIAYYRNSRPDRYASMGIVNEQGENWHNLRTKLTPEITSPRTITAFLPTLNTICDDFIKLLRKARDADGRIYKFEEFANRMGLETTCTLMLGQRMGFMDEVLSPRSEKLAKAIKQMFISQRDTHYGLQLWKYIPTKAYSKLKDSEDTIYNIISEIVDSAVDGNENTYAEDDVRSIFMSILQTPGLDIKDKKSAIIDFIAAGIETLANTLTFVLYLLAKNKMYQEKILGEVLTDTLSVDDLANASYTKASISESFRLIPTAFCVCRCLEADTELSGYALKAGTIVICQTMLACHQEANFINAEKFLPERWLEKKLSPSHHLVVPFGAGRRTCPGKRFVEQELRLIIAKMVRQFDVQFEGELEVQFEFLLAPLRPVNNIILKDRINI